MLFVLAGPSYVGKKTAIAHFVKLYAFSSVIPYTTKAKNPEEIEGIQYHYTTEEYINSNKSEFFYDQPFHFDNEDNSDEKIYAYKKKDIDDAINSYGNFIIHASVGNAKQIFEKYKKSNCIGESLFIIFLNYQSGLTEEFFKSKYPFIINGENDSKFIRRFQHAKKEQQFYKKNKDVFEECFTNDNAYDLCDLLENFILPKLEVMPTSPDKIPGPLSDEDIIYMAFCRRNDRLVVQRNNVLLDKDGLKGILGGCGMHITLSSSIRVVKSNIFNNYIDMTLDENNMKDMLNKMYPLTSMATGYILEPNEVILCSSNEKINIPRDVYAIVSARFSYSQLGLTIELGSSVVQAGHNGRIHFQIKNNTNNYICIYPNIAVAQLLFFRTVHPSSNTYRELLYSHSYDEDSTPPISKFRKKNGALENVHKPKTTLLKALFDLIKESAFKSVAGVAVLIILMVFGRSLIPDDIGDWIGDVFISIFGSSINIEQCFFIAILAEVLHILIIQLGRLINFASKALNKKIHNISRQNDNKNQSE